MRTILTTIIPLLSFVCLFGQAPQGINYQAVARDANGAPSTSPVGVTFKIFDNSAGTGQPLFSETHPFVTPSQSTGLFNLTIGAEKPTEFAALDWGSGQKFLQVNINGEQGPITQMMSVPFALYAANGGSGQSYTAGDGITISGGVISNAGDNDNDPSNEIQTLTMNGNTLALSNGGGTVTLSSGTDSQTLSTNGDQLSISNGNSVNIDGSTTNEIQQLSLSGNQLTLSNGGGSVTLASVTDSQTLSVNGNQLSISNGNSVILPTDGDGNAFNEIQTLSVSGNLISLSNGGGTVTIPQDGDGSSTNEIQGLTINGNTLTLTNGGNSVTLPAGTNYSAGNGISINGGTISNTGDSDNDPSNEFQQLQLNGNTLSLTNGNSVSLPTGTIYQAGNGISINGNVINNTGDMSNNNEIQNLTVNGNQLSISGGNTVNLPTGSNYQAGTGISISGNTISATDNSTTNEIQQLQLNGSSLTLTKNGGTVNLPVGDVYIQPNNNNGGTQCGGGYLPFDCETCVTSQYDAAFKVTNTCNGRAILGVSDSNAGSTAGIFGRAIYPNGSGNGTWGECNEGSEAWGVYGKSDTGFGVSGYTGDIGNNYYNGAAGLFNNRIIVHDRSEFNFANWYNGSYTLYRYNGQFISSDRRLKKDIEPINYGLNEVLKMKPVSYNWINESNPRQRSLGFIAQEMDDIVPELVLKPTEEEIEKLKNEPDIPGKSKKDGTETPKLALNYTELTPVLVKAIQEQQAQIEDLKAQLTAKDDQMALILQRLEKLEKGGNTAASSKK